MYANWNIFQITTAVGVIIKNQRWREKYENTTDVIKAKYVTCWDIIKLLKGVIKYVLSTRKYKDFWRDCWEIVSSFKSENSSLETLRRRVKLNNTKSANTFRNQKGLYCLPYNNSACPCVTWLTLSHYNRIRGKQGKRKPAAVRSYLRKRGT